MVRSRTIGVLPIAFVLAAGTLCAQTDRGTITGTVSDPHGALIPGASVIATHQATNSHYKASTSAAGE